MGEDQKVRPMVSYIKERKRLAINNNIIFQHSPCVIQHTIYICPQAS